jgi:WD40 repeat protein
MDDAVTVLAIAPDGTLYAGGFFTTADGISANYIARWDGSTWSPLGGGMDATVIALAISPDGTLYAGGFFTTADGISANYIAQWDGTTWRSLGVEPNNAVYSLAIAPDGTLYAGGLFTAVGVVNADRIARWDGATWSPLGGGVDDVVSSLAIAPDGTLYAGGFFTVAGGTLPVNRVAVWNGFRWLPVDLEVPPASNVTEILWRSDGSMYIAGEFSGTAFYSAVSTITVNGTLYPQLVITAATPARVQYLENATTGQRVWLDSRLLSGETLTVDFNNATATSSFSGNVLRNVVPGSDMRLKLVRGSNIIRLFVPSGTVTAQLRWSPQYDSLAEALAS